MNEIKTEISRYVFFRKDAENAIDGAINQRGSLKDNAKRTNTSTMNQEKAGNIP